MSADSVTPFVVAVTVACPGESAVSKGGSSVDSPTTAVLLETQTAPLTATPKLSRNVKLAVSLTSIVRAAGDKLICVTLPIRVTVTPAEELFPARSRAVSVIALRPGLSGKEHDAFPSLTEASRSLQFTATSPETASLTVPVTWSVELVVTIPTTGEVNVTAGGVRSMFSVTCTRVMLPAESIAMPVIDWPEPSVLTVVGVEQVATATSSWQRKLTVTGVMCQELMGDGN